MRALRAILAALLLILTGALLFWYMAVPDDLLRQQFEDAVARSGNGSMTLKVKGFRKGLLLSLSADSIELDLDSSPAFTLTDFRAQYSPLSLFKKQIGFSLGAVVGSGTVRGYLGLPVSGHVTVKDSELSAIPYLTHFGLDIRGSADLDITMSSETIDVHFQVPDLFIDDTSSVIPLLNTFRTLQGALDIRGRVITLKSVTLEGEKGFARLKGSISGPSTDLSLELMPEAGKLNEMEKMLVGKYIVSPGYYVVPIKRKFRN